MGRAILEVRYLWVGDGPTASVRGVSFTVGAGQVLGVLGGPGAGKSRLLRCVGLDYPPTRGAIFLRGEAVSGASPAQRRALRSSRIELVHPPTAEDALHPSASALRARPTPAGRPGTVPVAGMRQRIQIAKALSKGTDVLLLDEPFTGVDPVVGGRIRELLARLRAEVGTAVVLATRDPRLCEELADEVLVLEDAPVGRKQPAPKRTA